MSCYRLWVLLQPYESAVHSAPEKAGNHHFLLDHQRPRRDRECYFNRLFRNNDRHSIEVGKAAEEFKPLLLGQRALDLILLFAIIIDANHSSASSFFSSFSSTISTSSAFSSCLAITSHEESSISSTSLRLMQMYSLMTSNTHLTFIAFLSLSW